MAQINSEDEPLVFCLFNIPGVKVADHIYSKQVHFEYIAITRRIRLEVDFPFGTFVAHTRI